MDLRSALARPDVFDPWQRIVGADRAKRTFVEQHVLSCQLGPVVELGCGTGALCRYLPHDREYIGIDISDDYVAAAQRAYPSRTFLVGDLGAPDTLHDLVGNPSLVVCFGVLHHLDDRVATRAISGAAELLGSGGTFLAAEPCYYPGAGWGERLLKQLDRGQYIRPAERYGALVGAVFDDVEVSVETNWMAIRYGLALVAGHLPHDSAISP